MVNGQRAVVALLVLLLAILSIDGGCMRSIGHTVTVQSPDSRLVVRFSLVDGAPRYEAVYNDTPVILPSAMGFTFRRALPMTGGFEIKGTAERTFDETWKPVWGQRSEIRNHYNELTVNLREKKEPYRLLDIVFRVFDDGLGFRYEFPGQDGLRDFEIMSEETQFLFARDHIAWWTPADFDSYEHLYTESPLSKIDAANTPVTLKTDDGLYLCIHEANLTDYAGMTLARVTEPALGFTSNLVPWPDGSKVKGTTPFKSPWRTIQISTWPGGLVESSLILNLNEPCVLEDTSWIKPMKYIGIWWGMHIDKYTWHIGDRHGATTENAERYIDFAAKHAIPAVLIEGWNTGWDRWGQEGAYDYVTPYPDFDLAAVVAYARSKGVVIIGHHETGGDVPGYEKQLDKAFALYRDLGIPAVKTGYAGAIFPRGYHHHGQWMVRHYRMVVKKAADYHLMLDVHEPIKDTGISRTYPNMMTREGVRGTEYNAWETGNPPEHMTILPFTRMVAGPLDYTPGIFDITFEKYKPNNRVHSTLANQLALFVVLYSPLQMAADLIENYEGHPAFTFIEAVPVNWDETRVLNGEIGDYVTIARRSGASWYIGSITDENARVLTVNLDFLEPDRSYVARIYADAADADFETNPTAYEIREDRVTRETILTLELAPGGGQAIAIVPEG
jgi:hypothetical protein